MKTRNYFAFALIVGTLFCNLLSLHADPTTLRAELAAEIAKKASIKPYGTNPGYYDQSMKASYETAITAGQALIDETSTDETALTAAKANIIATTPTIIFPTAGKTYYIQAPRPASTFATSTGTNTNIECRALLTSGTDAGKNTQKWTVVAKNDGFLLSNIIGGFMTTDNTFTNGQSSSYLQVSDTEPTNPIYFTISTDNNGAPLDGCKRFWIERPSNAFRLHAGGSPTSLMNWIGASGTGSKTDNCSWQFIEVSSKNDLETAINLARTQLGFYIKGGDVVGSIPTTDYEAFQAKLDAAQAVLDNASSTEANYQAALATIVAETEAFTPTMVEPMISDDANSYWYLIHNVWQAGKYMAASADNATIRLEDKSSHHGQLWKLISDGAGKIKLVSNTGKIIGAGAQTSASGTWLTYTQKKPNQYAFFFEGQSGTSEGLHCGTAEATTVVTWNNSGSSNWWTFEEATKNMTDLADLITATKAIRFGEEGQPVDNYPYKQLLLDAITAAELISEASLFNDYFKALTVLQSQYDNAMGSIIVGIKENQSAIKIVVENGQIKAIGTPKKPAIFSQTGIQMDANRNIPKGVYIAKIGSLVQKVIIK